MAIKKTTPPTRPTINLDGPQGNAFFLIGQAGAYAKPSQLNLDFPSIHQEMTSGDHDHLLLTFEKYFGEYVDLETDNERYLKLFEDFNSYKEEMINSDKEWSVSDFCSLNKSK